MMSNRISKKCATALAEYETIGKQVSSLVDKINREEDAAVEDYNKHAGESTTLREALAKLLRDAEPTCRAAGKTIKEMKAEYIGDRLGDTQFKQILRVSRGQITFQEIKDAERDRKHEQRARKKGGTSELSRPSADEAQVGTSAEFDHAQVEPAMGNWQDRHPKQTTRVGNDVDTEASAKEMSDAMAELDGAPVETEAIETTLDDGATEEQKAAQVTPEKISKRALYALMSQYDDYLPQMTTADKAAAYRILISHSEMRGVSLKKAAA